MASAAPHRPLAATDDGMSLLRRLNLRFLEPIWHVSGKVDLAPGQPGEEAFDRLEPLFRETGTTRERSGDTMTFRKVDPAAQDRMAVFDDGVLRVEGAVLHYRMTSRILLFCFLAPLLFLTFGQATVLLGKLHSPSPPTAAEKKKAAERLAHLPMSPIDKFLGAPEPERLKKKSKDGKEEEGGKKPSPTPSYVFAGIFAALYAIGRVLEQRMVGRLFRTRLLDG